MFLAETNPWFPNLSICLPVLPPLLPPHAPPPTPTIQHIFIHLKYITQQGIKCIKRLTVEDVMILSQRLTRRQILTFTHLPHWKSASKPSYCQQSWLQLQCRTCDTNLDHSFYLVVGSQSRVSAPAGPALLRNLLDMPIPGPHPRPTHEITWKPPYKTVVQTTGKWSH